MDTFNTHATTLISPIRDALAVAPSNAAVLANMTRAVYIGGAGSLAVVTAGGQSVVFQNLPAGSMVPVRVTQILATGTTATGILALW